MSDARRLPPKEFAALYGRFADGLPARAAIMRGALDALGVAPSVDAATRLYMAAHALRGTAMVYGALELVPHAQRLETWSDTWRRDGRADPAALAEARRELEVLSAAIDAAARQRPKAKPR